MLFTVREWWTILHGLFFGALYLLAFVAVLVELSAFRRRWTTLEGVQGWLKRLRTWTVVLATFAWSTVLSGTYVIFPWYRAVPPAGSDLANYPKFFLLSRIETSNWHILAAEWKEHVGWFSPILATALAYVVSYYRAELSEDRPLRRGLVWLTLLSFTTAAIAGIIGALLNKVAPIR